MTIVNFIGVRESAIMTNIFTVGKIVPLLIFAAVGLFFIQPANFTFGETPEYGKFSEAVLLLIYAFVGFEAAVIPAGETKDPQKNVPFALADGAGFLRGSVYCYPNCRYRNFARTRTIENAAGGCGREIYGKFRRGIYCRRRARFDSGKFERRIF